VTRHLLIFLVGVVLASVGQILMKLGALRSRARRLIASLLDPYSVAGYALMLTSTITSTIALKVLPLKVTVSLLPLGYVIVVLLSRLVLGERMRRGQLFGMFIILAGIILFNQGPL
jgi:drug/metabolite transporter (DMT)-like permease